MKLAALATAIVLAAATPASATMVFDGSTLGRDASGVFGINGGAFGRYSFASTTSITSFATLNTLGAPASLTFQIYDSNTGVMLYTSAPKAFAADASASVAAGTFKKSDIFSFTFNPGTIYAIGAVSNDGSTLQIGSFGTKTENGISALLGNQNVIGGTFGTGQFCCSIATQFFTGEGAVVPEPMSWSMLLVGFALVGGVARRRAATAAA